MSWDCTLYRFSDGAKPQMNDEGEFVGESIGGYKAVKKMLNDVLSLHWDSTGSAFLESPDFTIEFNLRKETKEIRSIMLNIHTPEFALHAVRELCIKYDLAAFDHQQGKFLNFDGMRFEQLEEDEQLSEDAEDEEEDDEFTETITRPQVIEIKYMDN